MINVDSNKKNILYDLIYSKLQSFYNKLHNIISLKTILISITALLFLNVYFFYHVVVGANNYFQEAHLKQEKSIKTTELYNIKKQNEKICQEISLLESNSIDEDFLEELARYKLNYSYPDEMVVIYSK